MLPRTVFRNDWSVLVPPPLSGPFTRRASVVIPVRPPSRTLALTLAALAAQTYPAALFEVIVAVDDGPQGTLELPPIRPQQTRTVPVGESWGRSAACAAGVLASDAEVIVFLDSDMIPARDHLAAQLRWHHLGDHLAVLGEKLFVDPSDDELPSAEEVRDAVAGDRIDDLFPGMERGEHDWVMRHRRRTAELTTAGTAAFQVFVGASGSVTRALYERAGGMDISLRLGEDTEFGYRLAQAGAVFVPEPAAPALHVGRTTASRRHADSERFNVVFLGQRIPLIARMRGGAAQRDVPMLEIVVDTRGRPFEDVRDTVDAALEASIDARVVLVGEWEAAPSGRFAPLDDPQLDARLLAETYRTTGRVTMRPPGGPAEHAPVAVLTLDLPVGCLLGAGALDAAVAEANRAEAGVTRLATRSGEVVELRRVAAVDRARWTTDADDADELAELAATLFGSIELSERAAAPKARTTLVTGHGQGSDAGANAAADGLPHRVQHSVRRARRWLSRSLRKD